MTKKLKFAVPLILLLAFAAAGQALAQAQAPAKAATVSPQKLIGKATIAFEILILKNKIYSL